MNRHNDCLILVADDDRQVCEVFSRFFVSRGYRAAKAFDGKQALELFEKAVPSIAIIDVCMPVMDGLQFLEHARKLNSSIPVIITTGQPDIDGAIRSVQNGAFDYMVKPVPLELLEKKVTQALRSTKMARENAVLTELASLHRITREFAHTHDPVKLLDLVFDRCMEVAEADSGALQIFDRINKQLLTVRHRGNQSGILSGPNQDGSGKNPRIIADGAGLPMQLYPGTDCAYIDALCGLQVQFLLRAGEESIGQITLWRNSDRERFTAVEINSIDVLTSQAAIAIHNAYLYSSIRGQLTDLSLISSYSERLMGLIETDQIIDCLFEATAAHFPVDIAGYLSFHRRTFEFLYWSSWDITEAQVRTIVEPLIDELPGKQSPTGRKRISFRRMGPACTNKCIMPGSLQYRNFYPLSLEGVEYGGLFFGALTPQNELTGRLQLLSGVINQTQLALTNSRLYGDMRENYLRTIKALAIAVDAKDTYTHGHSENVMHIAEEIAREMGLDQRRIDAVRDGGLLHDIGKIGIPGYILNKPGSLTYEEFNSVMKTHTTLGANIVQDVPFLRDLHELILYHHENYDGTGYPEGLKGEAIPLGARILHVADAFEAMTSNRPYRKSLGEHEALRRLKSGRGKQFDPAIVDAFLAVAAKKGWIPEVSEGTIGTVCKSLGKA